MELNPEIINVVSEALQKQYGFATVTQLDKAVADLLKKTEERAAAKKNTFSLSQMIRGLKAMKGDPLNPQTQEADLQCIKALETNATTGSYLVPTIQANEIIEFLTLSGVVRAAGARIWDLTGIDKLDVPIASALPTWAWVGQNTSTTASDPTLGQLNFRMKQRRALVVTPRQLLMTSRPAYDTLLSELLGIGAAEHEDTAVFNTTSVTGGPASLYVTATTSDILVGGSANGGNIAYTDITATLAAAAAAKARGPFVWFMSPRTWYNRILGLVDTTSRPIVVNNTVQGAQNLGMAQAGMLMGFPVFVSPAILENISNGSGSSQSYLVLTNARYINIGEQQGIELAISTERYFELDQIGIRATSSEDIQYGPEPGIVVLKGIN